MSVIAAVLVVVGALNWGLVGLARFDLVAAIFGDSMLASIVYILVGFAGAYFLIRSYADLDDRQARQDAFYGSDAWRHGPREAIVSRIEHYLDTVLWLSPQASVMMRYRHSALSFSTDGLIC